MSIFNVNWRGVFSFAQPPRKRAAQTLDLGQSLLTTLQTDSDALAAKWDDLQVTKKYSCVKMVLQASLNEIFGETTFEVETDQTIFGFFWMGTEDEQEFNYFGLDGEKTVAWLSNSFDGTPSDASFTVKVPAGLYASNLDQVREAVRLLKVSGKSYKLVSL